MNTLTVRGLVLAAVLVHLLNSSTFGAPNNKHDVVIYGLTSAGIAAAVQAKKIT